MALNCGLTAGLTKGLAAGLTKSGGGWTPLDMESLLAWWNPGDTSTITESSGSVSELADLGPSGYDLAQLSASNQPTTDSDNINGQNVIFFDSANIEYLRSSGLSIPVFDGNDFCVTLAVEAADTNHRTYFTATGICDIRSLGLVPYAGAGSVNVGVTATTTPRIISIHMADTENSVWLDGVLHATVTYSDLTSINCTGFDLGTAIGGTRMSGNTSQSIVYRDASERGDAELYLAELLGITLP